MPNLRVKQRRVNHVGFGPWGGGPDPVVGRHQRTRLNGKNQGRVPKVWMFADNSQSLAAKRKVKSTRVMVWSVSNGVAKVQPKQQTKYMFKMWHSHPSAETQHFVPSKLNVSMNAANLNGFAVN